MDRKLIIFILALLAVLNILVFALSKKTTPELFSNLSSKIEETLKPQPQIAPDPPKPPAEIAAADPPKLAAAVLPQTPSPDPTNPESMGPPLPKRVFLKQVEESRKGFGRVKNYTTLGILFAPEYRTGHFLPMLDFRISNINNLCKMNTYGTNLGFVARSIPKTPTCWMFGLNAYWDFRQGSLTNWFQFGAGMEFLGKYCDFRINGYVPLQGKYVTKHTFDVGEGLFTKRIKFEYPFMGFNAELGWKIMRMQPLQIYLAGGTYYIHGSYGKNAWGGSFRIRPQYRDFIAVDLQMSDDSIFHLIYQLQVIFSFPLYHTPKGQKRPCGIYNREIYQPVERWELITLNRGTCWKNNF